MRGRGQPGPAAAEGPRRTLQVDARSQGSARSPSVSPERGSTPTSPYSVPQIAPLPSSTLCPICKTTELTSSPGQPNFNACTQCHSKVCNQCGFNPNPHLTQVMPSLPPGSFSSSPPGCFGWVLAFSKHRSCTFAFGSCKALTRSKGSAGNKGIIVIM